MATSTRASRLRTSTTFRARLPACKNGSTRRSLTSVRRGNRQVFALQAIHAAIDVVADLFAKYKALIQGETLHPGVIMSYWPTVPASRGSQTWSLPPGPGQT